MLQVLCCESQLGHLLSAWIWPGGLLLMCYLYFLELLIMSGFTSDSTRWSSDLSNSLSKHPSSLVCEDAGVAVEVVLASTLVPRSFRKAESASGLLSNVSCRMGWGRMCNECHHCILACLIAPCIYWYMARFIKTPKAATSLGTDENNCNPFLSFTSWV